MPVKSALPSVTRCFSESMPARSAKTDVIVTLDSDDEKKQQSKHFDGDLNKVIEAVAAFQKR